NLAALFAAMYPQRTTALITCGSFAKRIWAPDYPWAPTPEQRERDYEVVARDWGGAMDLANYVPSKVDDEAFMRRLATYFRRAARFRHRSRARYRAVHRHRRFDRDRGAARRPRLARTARQPPCLGAQGAGAFSRPRSEHHRRWFPRDFRRPRACDPLRVRGP